jgi:hypothetical protein
MADWLRPVLRPHYTPYGMHFDQKLGFDRKCDLAYRGVSALEPWLRKENKYLTFQGKPSPVIGTLAWHYTTYGMYFDVSLKLV